MRIAMVGNFPEPYGGVATTCFHLADQLTLSGYEVVFFDRSPHHQKIVPRGITEYYIFGKNSRTKLIFLAFSSLFQSIFDKKSRNLIYRIAGLILNKELLLWTNIKKTLQILSKIFQLMRYFKNDEIDIMHGNHADPESLCLMYFAKYYLECPFVVTVYASEFTMAEKSKWLSSAMKVCEESEAVMCISNFTRQQMLQAGVVPRIDFVIHLGVANEHFISPEQEQINNVINLYGLNNQENIILYVGWLIDRKGPQILVESLSQISGSNWLAIFIGPDHGLRDEIEKKMKEFGLIDQIMILGDIPYSDLMAFYHLASIFVFPTLSKDEGFGLVALEAMAHGLPVIASSTGAIPEVVIDQKTGLFITPGDYDTLALHLKLLLSNKRLRSDMSRNAIEVAKEFTWKRTTDQLIKLYRTAIQIYDTESI